MIKYCKKCECDTERYASGLCKACHKAVTEKYRAENADKERERHAKYRAENSDKIRDSNAKYRIENAEKCRAATTKSRLNNPECYVKWYSANKEKVSDYNAKYRINNHDKLRAYGTKYRAINKDMCRIYSHNRRARKRDNGGKLSPDLAEKLFKLQRGNCACCGLPLGDNYHLDHIIPLVLGGSNTDDNIQLLRQRCNLQKNAKHPIDFMQSRGFLL